MKSDKNILIAFLLNLFFSIFEFIGGVITNSISIVSDSIHDFGDAISIGISYILEKVSKKKPNKKYTYGYLRYSVLGALITTMILLIGSILIIHNAIKRIMNPIDINYNGMILFAIVGVIVNFIAAKVTKHGHSLNQKSVNLHMIEDVLGWIVVLIGAVIMKFTDLSIIDSILSVLVALYIFIHSVKNLKSIIDIFLEKTPSNISIENIKKEILSIDGVINIHHIHIWSMDGFNNYATMHVIVNKNTNKVKDLIRERLKQNNVNHVTIEFEEQNETCKDNDCSTKSIMHHRH